MSEEESGTNSSGPTIEDLYELKRYLHVKAEAFCELAGIPQTAYRRGKTVELSPENLAKLDRCSKAMDAAMERFPETAATWFHESSEKFAGRSPFDIAQLPEGLKLLDEAMREKSLAQKSVPVAAQIAVPSASTPPPAPQAVGPNDEVSNPDERQFRIKGLLKDGCQKLTPPISLSELARRVQKEGLAKFSAGTASRLDLGYADASWNELVVLAKGLGTTPHRLAGIKPPEIKLTPPNPESPAPVIAVSKTPGNLKAPTELAPRGSMGSIEYSKLLSAEAERAHNTMRLPQRELPPSAYREWKAYRDKIMAAIAALNQLVAGGAPDRS